MAKRAVGTGLVKAHPYGGPGGAVDNRRAWPWATLAGQMQRVPTAAAAIGTAFLAGLVLTWASLLAIQGTGAVPVASVRATLAAADRAAENGDAAGYEAIVDTAAFGTVMLESSMEAYSAFPSSETSAAAVERAAIQAAYSDYPGSVRAAIQDGQLASVPLYGLSGSEISVSGDRVLLSVAQPAKGDPASEGPVVYSLELRAGRLTLLGASGLAPQLQPVVAAIISAARE